MGRNFLIFIGVAAVHILTGLDILISNYPEAVVRTTPLSLIQFVVGGPYAIAFLLILAGALAIVPFCMLVLSRMTFILFVALQQVLLLSHAGSVVWAVLTGHYPDGYVPVGGTFFIFADQIWLLMLVVFHTIEYVRKQEEEF